MLNHHSRLATFAAAAIALTTSLVSFDASATPTFPEFIKATIGASAVPECAICHVNGVTGSGTVNTAFGKTMRARGLLPNNEGTLKTALEAITAEKKDSNGDGMTDIDALKAGKDPNGTVAADGGSGNPDTPETIQYGCARVAPKAPEGGTLALVIAIGALLVRRRARG